MSIFPGVGKRLITSVHNVLAMNGADKTTTWTVAAIANRTIVQIDDNTQSLEPLLAHNHLITVSAVSLFLGKKGRPGIGELVSRGVSHTHPYCFDLVHCVWRSFFMCFHVSEG